MMLAKMRETLYRFALGFAVVAVMASAAPALSESVSIEQLRKVVAELHRKNDKDAAQQLANLELTQRLSSRDAAELMLELPGLRAREVLTGIVDVASFLNPPESALVSRPPADTVEQKAILDRTWANVAAAVHQYPDFFATRTSRRLESLTYPLDRKDALVARSNFRTVADFTGQIFYREGGEVFQQQPANGRGRRPASYDASSLGLFGPILRTVIRDVQKGRVEWLRWERGEDGDAAVFRYAVPLDESHYFIRYCCTEIYEITPPYHGEIAVDPASGAILRLTLETELNPADGMFRNSVMAEYGPENIGGTRYICLKKSVTIMSAAVPQGNAFQQPRKPGPPSNITALIDDTFSDYHLFRSEMRIVK